MYVAHKYPSPLHVSQFTRVCPNSYVFFGVTVTVRIQGGRSTKVTGYYHKNTASLTAVRNLENYGNGNQLPTFAPRRLI